MIRIREIVRATIEAYIHEQLDRDEVDDIAHEEGFDCDELDEFGDSILKANDCTIWGFERVYGKNSEGRFQQCRFERSIHVNDPPKRL